LGQRRQRYNTAKQHKAEPNAKIKNRILWFHGEGLFL
jgi:hypothetical protein